MMSAPTRALVLLLLLLLVIAAATAKEAQECVLGDDGECTDDCTDWHEQCNEWARAGECTDNPGYMIDQCRRACRTCDMSQEERDALTEERLKVIDGRDEEKARLRREFGVHQDVRTVAARKKKAEMDKYMNNQVFVEDRYEDVRSICLNQQEECVNWASIGECEVNPKFMLTKCAPACQTCHLMIFEERCPFDPTNTTSELWKAGSVNAMFERIVKDYGKDVEVLSQPPDGPWVVTMDNFLSEAQTDRLINMGKERGYEKSKDVGELQPDGTYSDYDSPDRTSANTWCLEECYEDPITQDVITKLVDVTGVPDDYAEYLQLLEYHVGQFYGQHHDYIPHLRDRAEGVRIATVFLYLNDVEAGGGTRFSDLDITVMPKRGKALFWPSVLDEDPNEKDDRTDHEALPVEAGIKYGANAWLHNREFKEAFERGCA